MSESNIEQGAPPLVSSLRSRFEALAAQQNGGAGTNPAANSSNAPSKINSPFLANGVGSKSTGNAGAVRGRGNSSHSVVPSISSLVGDNPPTPTVVVHEVAEPSRRVVSTPVHIPRNSLSRSSSSSSLNASVHSQDSISGRTHRSPPLKRTTSFGLASSLRVEATTPAKPSPPGEPEQSLFSMRAALERPAPPPPPGDTVNIEDQLKPHKMCVLPHICFKLTLIATIGPLQSYRRDLGHTHLTQVTASWSKCLFLASKVDTLVYRHSCCSSKNPFTTSCSSPDSIRHTRKA